MLGALSSAPYGGPDIAEVDRVGRRLRDRSGEHAQNSTAAQDAQMSNEAAQKRFDAIGSRDKTFRVFTADEGGAPHCLRDYLPPACEVLADWLEVKFK
jgi:hypothetical protein